MLRAAYREALLRFGKSAAVCGIGVGRKFKEGEGAYAADSAVAGGFCIKVFVEHKKDPQDLSRAERIPRWLSVRTGPGKKKTRVPLDVVSVAGESKRRPVARLQQGRGWPTAGKLTPGRIFTFGKQNANSTPAEFGEHDVRIGTTASVLKMANGDHHAISAGHVFTNPCLGQFTRPQGEWPLGVTGRTWSRVDGDDFEPLTIQGTDYVRDLMAFPVPAAFVPGSGEITWPDGFSRELATQEDIERAVLSTSPLAFIWIDRKDARPRAIPVDLEAAVPRLTMSIQCGNSFRVHDYILTWPLRFLPGVETTIGGDSGAPVFLWAADNSRCRLLGVHFLEVEGHNHSYAMDARSFLQEVLGVRIGQNCEFL